MSDDAQVIVLAERREEPGTLWWSGVAKCIQCAHEHVAVAPIPAWAVAPGSLECPSCGRMAALPMAEAPGTLNATPGETPWAAEIVGLVLGAEADPCPT
jgi:hypothetical protein